MGSPTSLRKSDFRKISVNNPPKVFILIVNYNGKETIKKCLGSVFNLDYPSFEVVVIDNGSTDGSLELAKNLFSKAHFILNDQNLGFAAANNIGIRFAMEKMADYVFLLNNDALIEKSTLTKIVGEAEKVPAGGIFSPLIYNNQNEIWFAGGYINWLSMKTTHSVNKLEKIEPTEYVTGCAMLIKKDVFKIIGLFDEKYFLYYEDADFCLRAKKVGILSCVIPGTVVHHAEKSEENKKFKTYWLVVSGIIFFEKNSPLIYRSWINFYLFLRKTKNLFDITFKRNLLAPEVRRAYKDTKQWQTPHQNTYE